MFKDEASSRVRELLSYFAGVMKIRMASLLMILYLLHPVHLSAQEVKSVSDSAQVNKKTIYRSLGLTGSYYATSILILNNTWYKGKDRVPFHFYNDNRGYLQVDKFGHMFGGYVYSYAGYHGLLELGATRKEALIFGSTLGFVLQFPIEIMDGLHEGYGFSWGDVAANTMGSVLVLGQELAFGGQLVRYKFSYREPEYPPHLKGFYGQTYMTRLLKDYNGHTYWLTLPLNKVVLRQKLPPWISLAFGYGANGMYGEFENIATFNGTAVPETERYRQFLLSPDIEWSRIKTESKFLKLVFHGMSFIKVPLPALEYTSKGRFKGHWLYY